MPIDCNFMLEMFWILINSLPIVLARICLYFQWHHGNKWGVNCRLILNYHIEVRSAGHKRSFSWCERCADFNPDFIHLEHEFRCLEFLRETKREKGSSLQSLFCRVSMFSNPCLVIQVISPPQRPLLVNNSVESLALYFLPLPSFCIFFPKRAVKARL